MTPFQDRRILIGVGAGAAVLAGVAAAVVIGRGGEPAGGNRAAPSAERGLQVEMGLDESKLDPQRTLRCFVGGQFVGLATLAECAKKNGVAAQALDVGLDQTGELAAASGDAPLQPIAPAEPAVEAPPAPPAPAATPAAAPADECLRFGSDGWRAAAAGAASLNACVQALFQGRCVRAGEAAYGRWGGQTLRLLPGRVESAPDNRNFHMIAEQNPRDCSIAPVP